MVNYTFSSYCGYTALQTSNGIANKQWRSHPNSHQTLTAHHADSCMVWVASDRHGYACVCVCVCVRAMSLSLSRSCGSMGVPSLSPAFAGQREIISPCFCSRWKGKFTFPHFPPLLESRHKGGGTKSRPQCSAYQP